MVAQQRGIEGNKKGWEETSREVNQTLQSKTPDRSNKSFKSDLVDPFTQMLLGKAPEEISPEFLLLSVKSLEAQVYSLTNNLIKSSIAQEEDMKSSAENINNFSIEIHHLQSEVGTKPTQVRPELEHPTLWVNLTNSHEILYHGSQ